MLKRSLYLILCLVIAIAMLASCDNTQGGNENHEHTFAENKWLSDATGHWYGATCSHTDELGSFAEHTDANDDGKCDVCNWYDPAHKHTYSKEWSVTENEHWLEPSCEHTGIDVSKKAAHKDNNKDGSCDTCKYTLCYHDYSEEWTVNDDYHWHEHICGCKIAPEYIAHSDEDENSFCDTCGMFNGEVNESDLLSLLHGSVSKHNLVNGSVVDYTNVDGSNTLVTVVLGDNDTYVKYDYVTTESYQENWFNRIPGSDEVFAVVSLDGASPSITSGSIDQLNGYYYALSNLTHAYTVEQILLNLYKLSQEPTATGYVIEQDTEANTCVFSFNYLLVNYVTVTDPSTGDKVTNLETYYFEIEVSFNYNDDYAILSADFSVDAYSSRDVEDEDENGEIITIPKDYLDVDIANGIIEMLEGAAADRYVYKVTQTVGERSFDNPYAKDKVLLTDFDLFTDESCDANSKVGETVKCEPDTFVKLYLGNIVPANALFTENDFVLSAKYANNNAEYSDSNYYFTVSQGYEATEGEEAPLPNQWASIFVNNDAVGRDIIFTITYVGVGGQGITKTVRIEVKDPDADENDIDKNVSGASFEVKVTDAYTYVDEYIYTASAAGTYTFNLAANDVSLGFGTKEAVDKDSKAEVDVFSPGNNKTEFTVELDEGETLEFYVGAAVKGIYTITVDVK